MSQTCVAIVMIIFSLNNIEIEATRKMSLVQLAPMNIPAILIEGQHRPKRKFELMRHYTDYVNEHVREPRTQEERTEVLNESQKRLVPFLEEHTADLKRLLVAMDKSLMAMDLITLGKKLDAAVARTEAAKLRVPFGVYVSPEYKCLGTSYYVVSSHSQDDVQDILDSKRKPHCYNFKGAFQFGGFYHRHGEATYVGPHSEVFQMDNTQGLYCSNNEWAERQCVYKINPLPEFPESVQYESKISYQCGDYRYYIPAIQRVRCLFSARRMRFELWFTKGGVEYIASGVDMAYPNGQKMYTDEPWSRIACSDRVCKWRRDRNVPHHSFHFTS